MFKGQRIEITEYERANLLAALYAASGYAGHSPLHVLSTGDWLYQVLHKLGWKGSLTDWGRPSVEAKELVHQANTEPYRHDLYSQHEPNLSKEIWKI